VYVFFHFRPKKRSPSRLVVEEIQNDYNSTSTSYYDDLLKSARQEAGKTSCTMNAYNNHENDMKTLLITEGQDLVYRESLSLEDHR
jgi:hypothetical protein